ncbi:sugar ABC transporter permease [Nocardioides limicola]|uniref:sugar ABC transporter permease n=1 Tax=Nocardioides limicola TaxID=2803368 RepID=UPI00193C345B|nr:ABC transporter permease subunit [Nocardioides sp. DJM-14]
MTQDLAPSIVPDARRTRRRARSSRSRWWREVGWRHAVGLIAVIWALFPISYIVSAAFNPLGNVVSTGVIPRDFSLVHFETLLNSPSIPFGRWAMNTLFVCATVTVTQLLCSGLAAYAFSRFRFRGRRGGLLTLLLIQMFPQFLAAVALYTLFTEIGHTIPMLGLNTVFGYTLVLLGGALGQVWLIKGFFDTVPRSLDEAARIDGASHAQTFFLIILPLAKPIFAVSGLLVFVGVVAEFLLASIFLTDPRVKTLSVGLFGLIDSDRSNNLGVFAAGALLTALPVVLVFLYLQRFIVGGLTSGGVKG